MLETQCLRMKNFEKAPTQKPNQKHINENPKRQKAYTFSCNNFRIVEFYFLRCWVFKLGIIMIKCFTPKSVAEFSTQVQIIYTYQKTGQTVWPWQSRLQQLFSLFIKDFQISTSASESFFPISFSNTFQRFNPFNVNVVLR